MDEPKRTFVHVFPFAANQVAPYLLTGLGQPWRSDFVRADDTVHAEMERTLRRHGVDPAPEAGPLRVTHSPSWHDAIAGRVDVYFAILDVGDAVIDRYPDALPIEGEIRREAGLPPVHGATMPPAVRRLDVAVHALRHLRLLTDPAMPTYDATVDAKLDDNWRRHLDGLTPALSGLYAVDYDAA